MKKTLLTIGLSTALVIGSVYAADPGSKDDPLVTKSYVDDQVERIVNEAIEKNERIEELEETIEAQQILLGKLLDQIDSPVIEGGSQTYELVSVDAGDYLFGEQGTELILRGGRAKIVGSINGGIQNVTEGVDLSDGVDTPKNHLLIVPRTEDRGIFAETDIIVLVRGGYTIQ